jgi:hypothetical protein
MKEKKKEGLYVTTKISTAADQNLSKFQALHLVNTGQKLKKMDALNKMLEDYPV